MQLNRLFFQLPLVKIYRFRLLILYLLFCGISLFLYRNCIHAHFLDDSLSSFQDYKLKGAGGFLNSFDFPSLYYGHDFFYLGYYFLFGLNPIAWHLLFIGLFCLNTLLIFKISEIALQKLSFKRSSSTAFLACLFFLFSPYQTENVVWIATLHYQIAMLCLFSGMLLILQDKRGLIWIHLFFALSLLTLEITLIFPAIWVVTFVIFRKSWLNAAKQVILPQIMIIVLYFIAMKLLKGSFIPHYGTVHIDGWSPLILLSTLLKYFLKLFGFVHFYEYDTRTMVYGWCDNYLHVGIVWIAVAALLSFFLFKTKFKAEAKVVLILLYFSFIALLPVLNMYFMFLCRVENDRLSFFATPFLYLMLAFLITRFPYFISIPFSVFILVMMKYFLWLYTSYWINAAEIQQRTLDSYQWFDKKKVYMLNLPQNFGGAYIYRRESRFATAMLVRKNLDISKQIKAVAGQNMDALSDGVTVKSVDSVSYIISANGTGWFWNGALGAFDYQTEDYTFKLNANSYTLTFHRPLQQDEAIVYQQDGVWSEVKQNTQ